MPEKRFSAIDIATASFVLSAIFLFLWFHVPEGHMFFRHRHISPAYASEEPQFIKEGELTFLSKKGKNDMTTIDIEIADSDYERTRGLMYRHSLPDNAGMLFIFDRADVRSFWMRNTYIPLDIVFIDEQKRVVAIATGTEPLSYAPISSTKKTRYVVEVNAGFCKKHGISVGDRITYRAFIPRHRAPSP